MQVFIDYDHNAAEFAEQLIHQLSKKYEIICLGNKGREPYPVIARHMADTISKYTDARGILLCKTGIGMSIVANKVPGIYAHCCHTANECAIFRQNNNGNILCIGAQITPIQEAIEMADVFLNTNFCEEKRERIKLIENLFRT